MILVFLEIKGRYLRVTQFRKTVKVTKETGFTKHEILKNHEMLCKTETICTFGGKDIKEDGGRGERQSLETE
jgi:hypothetical protein